MLEKLDKLTEDGYYGMMSLYILVGSSIGGIMAMVTLEKGSLILMALGLVFTMMNLVLNIAQLPSKFITRVFLTSVFANIILIVIALLLN